MKSEISTADSTPSQLSMSDSATFIKLFNDYSLHRFNSPFTASHLSSMHRDMKGKTNSSFINDMIDFSPYGALAQMVLIQALEAGLILMVNNPMPDSQSHTPDAEERGIVSGDAFNGNVIHLLLQLSAMYRSDN